LTTSKPAEPAENRWDARPVVAGLLRVAIVLAPLAVSSAALFGLSHVWPEPAGGHTWWLASLALVAVLVAFTVERVVRRLLPLASLLRLTMLFPDQAPSRLRIARAAGTTGEQLGRLARCEDDTAQIAAEKVLTLITALGDHDRKTRGHSERVRLYCDMLAEQLKLPRADRDRLRWASLLHDIGKLEIAPAILNKPAKLSDREFARIREHPNVGAEIAAPLLPWLGEWGGGIIDHHERWDGHGYPSGRTGEGISRAGRIVGIVDAFETMTAARVYKKAMTTRAARVELAACAGSQFDPDFVRGFLAISLPRVLWAMGPLAFVIQLPFLRSLTRLGSQATQVSLQGASTAGVAAAASVIGVAATGAITAHVHPHSHSHSHSHVASASALSHGGALLNSTGVAVGAGANRAVVPMADSHVSFGGSLPLSHPMSSAGGGAGNPGGLGEPTAPGPGGGAGAGTGPIQVTLPTPSASSTPLTVSPVAAYVVQAKSAVVNVLDGAGDLVASTLNIVTAPSSGIATVGADGTVSYQPASGFHGIDQLVFEVCNAAGRCGSAPVTITVLQPGQSHADYNGADFAGLDLQGFDFSGASLRGADLSGANLTDVNFSNADLTDADLSSTSVGGVNVNGANLSGTNLSGVTGGTAPQFSGLSLTATIGQPVTINVANLVSDPDAPIDWSTLAITGEPTHGTARITGPHTIVYTPAAGLVSVDHLTFSVANVLTFGGSGSLHIAVVL
jgi:putative nucleotidyltransferase with HDIG domain